MDHGVKYREVIVLPDGRMDTRNTAIYTGYSEKTLAMQRCRGKGPKFVKLGRVFYYKKDVDDWLAQSQTVISTAQERAQIA